MLHLAITGHRSLHFPLFVSNQIDQGLAQLASQHHPPWIVYSLLAEGADRLVVERIFARYPARLIVPLPLAEDDYTKDFTNPNSIPEFKGWLSRADQVVHLPAAPRPYAYLQAGLYMLDHCSQLIAVWDELPPQGPGGTGQIVNEAQRRNMPIFKIGSGSLLIH